ncbi:MAG: DegT/DnrJ/EryC1/StrS family aminotransferase [Flavobacteriales bacterium]|nr:DegT/DnrJ/EryC1/StrS family aminotransferase [Flavobacteriales bacterium]
MSDIQMVDLKGQYSKIQQEVDTSILNAVKSGAFINGPQVSEFAVELQNYLSVKHVIPCANGTDALQISLMALGLTPGDEVITPSFTYIATVEVMALLGLVPKFIEVNPETFNIDVSQLKTLISPKTKAIVPVHLYGQCAHMEEILKIATIYNLHVIEDTAQAIGADYTFSNGTTKKAGTIGTIGCTSFFPSKNLGCYGDGGAIFTNDSELAKKLKMCANHGQSIKYHHDIIGVNSRLDTLQAAVLKVKLPHLDEYTSARNKAADYYTKSLSSVKGIITPKTATNSTHAFHQYTLKLDGIDQAGLRKYLTSKGIPTNIYYPIPVHLQKGYSYLGYKRGDLPLTEYLCQNTISLPIHTEMNNDIQDTICCAIKDYIKN